MYTINIRLVGSALPVAYCDLNIYTCDIQLHIYITREHYLVSRFEYKAVLSSALQMLGPLPLRRSLGGLILLLLNTLAHI